MHNEEQPCCGQDHNDLMIMPTVRVVSGWFLGLVMALVVEINVLSAIGWHTITSRPSIAIILFVVITLARMIIISGRMMTYGYLIVPPLMTGGSIAMALLILGVYEELTLLFLPVNGAFWVWLLVWRQTRPEAGHPYKPHEVSVE